MGPLVWLLATLGLVLTVKALEVLAFSKLFFQKMSQHWPSFRSFSSFRTIFLEISRIKTRIISVEGEDADYKTTITTNTAIYCKLIFLKSTSNIATNAIPAIMGKVRFRTKLNWSRNKS